MPRRAARPPPAPAVRAPVPRAARPAREPPSRGASAWSADRADDERRQLADLSRRDDPERIQRAGLRAGRLPITADDRAGMSEALARGRRLTRDVGHERLRRAKLLPAPRSLKLRVAADLAEHDDA